MTVLRKGLMATSMVGLAFGIGGYAAAQDTQSGSGEIIVTGTRIAQPNLITTSPVTQVTAEDIANTGVTRVEDLITQLPQAFAAQNSTVSNGASGTATVDLRNLGSSRTLVLVDGRRLPYGSPIDDAADLNQIPTPLVERVEVLTGGASAVYGSDAVAGVVNFIMRDDFEGLEIDAQYGFFQHNNDYDGAGNLREVIEGRAATNPSQFQLPDDNVVDGYSKQLSAVMGVSSPDGKGNVTAYATYRINDAVLQGQRDYSACSIGSAGATAFTCGGSGTSFPGRFTDFLTYDYTIDPATGEFRNWSSATDQYNFGPLNYYQRPDERYALGAFGRYEINKHAEVYTQLMFTDYQSTAQIAPSGNFFSTFGLSCDNPLLSSGQRSDLCEVDLVPDFVDDPETEEDEVADFLADNPLGGQDYIDATLGTQDALTGGTPTLNEDGTVTVTPFDGITPLFIGRRNVEGGGRQDSLGYQSYRGVVGVRGELVPGWDYDLTAQYSEVTLSRVYLNDFSTTRLNRALNVVTDPDTGEAVCASVLDGTDPNCVPYNIFSIGGVTPEALAYLQIPLVQTGTTAQQVVTGAITGDLGEMGGVSPLAESPIAVAFGLEYRRDELNTVTDTAFATGDGAGQGGPTLGLSGVTDVFEVFGEVQIPLIESRPFFELLAVDAAYRRSEYGTDVSTDTYKVGGEWAPTSDIRFRASYARAVRAPNVIDLFTGQGFNLFDLDADPCGPSQTASEEACLATGVSAAQYGSAALDSPAGQYNFLQGGNPDLEPEEADSYTIGFVFTPGFIPGFTASVDWWQIEIEKLIDAVDPLDTLTACYDFDQADACDRINRNSLGQLWIGDGFVEGLNDNTGARLTAGYDIVVNYQTELSDLGLPDYGAVSVAFVGTYLQSWKEKVLAPSSPYSCVGFYGNQCGVPNPEWRHRVTFGWETPWNVDVNATWRHLGEVELFGTTADRVDRYFDAENYLDFASAWQIRDNARLRFGVNNVLDNDPPLSASVGTTGNGNSYPQFYDAMGRYIFGGLTLNF